jgi:ABC-type uncharacterized transport system substrate-binding protein
VSPKDIAFDLTRRLSRNHSDALLVTTEAFTRQHLGRILDFANRNNIPAMFEDSSFLEAGGLMSYRPGYEEGFRTAAVLSATLAARTSCAFHGRVDMVRFIY